MFATVSLQNFQKKYRFSPLNLCFVCHDAKRALILLKKTFYLKKVDFPEGYVQNVHFFLIWRMRISQNLDFFAGLFQIFFLPFSFPFFRLFYCRYRWVSIMGKGWKWYLDEL